MVRRRARRRRSSNSPPKRSMPTSSTSPRSAIRSRCRPGRIICCHGCRGASARTCAHPTLSRIRSSSWAEGCCRASTDRPRCSCTRRREANVIRSTARARKRHARRFATTPPAMPRRCSGSRATSATSSADRPSATACSTSRRPLTSRWRLASRRAPARTSQSRGADRSGRRKHSLTNFNSAVARAPQSLLGWRIAWLHAGLSGGQSVAETAACAAISYRAFLSYSHRDQDWAKWLHAALEGYRIDRDLIGRATALGPVPKTLRPIFRDREDFSAGHSLTAQTLAALEASQFLIVICSPHAVQSKYVEEEIRRFKLLGRGDRIIPLIVEGEPGDPQRECFPAALRFKLAPDGSL